MIIALISLSAVCIILALALVYMIKIVAAYRVSADGYEFKAALSKNKDGKEAKKKGMF